MYFSRDALYQFIIEKSKNRLVRNGILSAAVCVVTGIYLGIGSYFSSHFIFCSTINGIECGKMTAAEAENEMAENLLDYRLELIERGGRTEYITGRKLGLSYLQEGQVEQILDNQNGFSWGVSLGSSKDYSIVLQVEYDPEVLNDLIDGLDCFSPDKMIEPQNAVIVEKDYGYEIQPEILGTTINRERLRKAVENAIATSKTVIDLDKSGIYESPEILHTDRSLQSEVKQLNELTTADIVFDFTDRKKEVNRSVIREMLTKDTGGNYFLDENKVGEWVCQLAYETDTFGLSRQFKKNDGNTITLPRGGDYGWCIDRPATTKKLYEAIKNGITGNMDPAYLYTGKDRGKNDIGDTYVEICISKQRMWFYKDGEELVDTPVVTGNPNKGNATPSNGVWSIDGVIHGQILRGEDYAQPVTYWMPFNGNVGIHDAGSFRSAFGYDIYLWNGSHGCINTPDKAAAVIFDNVERGTPVVVYD